MNMMLMDSKQIDYIGYVEEECELRVKYHSGVTYTYLDVSKEAYMSITETANKQDMLGHMIKGRQRIRCEQV